MSHSVDAEVDRLGAVLSELLGAEAVICDREELKFYSSDVYSRGVTAEMAIAPADREELPRAIAAITSAGFSVVPRGGGMSYTGGYTPQSERSVIVDLSRLRQIVEINPDDMTLTVEAGVTWKQIYDALAPLNLRLPFFGTFSGVRATVGGGMSNGALFMGTGRYGTAAEIALGLEVVTASGDVVRTGQSAFENGRSFYRSYGPDMTGLFIHDAGALGIKTLITLRMMRPPEATGFASFVFPDAGSAADALSAIARAGVAEEAYVFDPETTRRSLDGADLARDLMRLANVVSTEKNLLRGVRAAVGMIGAGRRFVAEDVYSLHVVCSGNSAASVESDIASVRTIADEHGGGEIADTMPRTARANPFEPLNGILGADGGRWAALNAKVAHSDARSLIDATDAIFDRHADAMQRRRVTVSRLFIAISNHAFSFEPVLRWYDEWLPVHRRTPEPAHLLSLEEPAADPDARRLVDEIRTEIVELFAKRGAASNQIGRTYPWFHSLNPQTAALVRALKKTLDPDGRMNPGALGLTSDEPAENRT